MSQILARTHNLVKTFNLGKPNEISPVKGVNLDIIQNTCTILKGASGSGKTTLLTILSCLSKPTQGEYYCLDEKVSRWSEKFLTKFRQKHIGIVFQHFHLIHKLSAFTNIALPLIPLRYNSQKMTKIVENVGEKVQLSHRLYTQVDVLSGGELQRVAIARALVNNPSLIFADEPTAHLDSEMSLKILEIFADLKAQGKTLFITTHDPLVEQHRMVDRVLSMKDGMI